MAGPRNRFGCNDADTCYRTIKGELYVAWMSCPSTDRIAAYREAGARVRRFKAELFIHDEDQKIAQEVDSRLE